MKVRLFSIIFITLSLIALVVVEQIYVFHTIEYMNSATSEIYDYIKQNEDINTPELIEKINVLDEKWTKKENILCLVVNHRDMEKVGEQIQKLKVLIPQNKKEEAEFEAELLVYYVDGYEHFIAVTFQNIF